MSNFTERKCRFSVRISIADDDPTRLRMIECDDWSGAAFQVPRGHWREIADNDIMRRSGIYIVSGFETDEVSVDRPVVHVGSGQSLKTAIMRDDRDPDKAFWETLTGFQPAADDGSTLDLAWIAGSLQRRAAHIGKARVFGTIEPSVPTQNGVDLAACEYHLDRILRILPILGLDYWEHRLRRRPCDMSDSRTKNGANAKDLRDTEALRDTEDLRDTIVVPMKKGAFDTMFMREKAWYAIRVPAHMLDELRWIAAFQTLPVAAVTHIAEIGSLEPYGSSGRYKVVFKRSAERLPRPIPFGIAPSGFFQGPRYLRRSQLMTAETVAELAGLRPPYNRAGL